MMDELLEEMVDPAPSQQEVARRRRLWATGAVLVLAAAGAASLTTSALFTDQDTLGGSITTGTVVLSAEGTTFEMPTGGLAPGGTVVAPLTVQNQGSLQLRYAVSMSASAATPPPGLPAGVEPGTGDLTTQLRVRLLRDVTCAVKTVTNDPDLDAKTLADVGRADVPGRTEAVLPTTMTPILGDPETGADTGDRTVDSQTSDEPLCVRVDMSGGAGNEFQNTAAELTFQLDSEQTVNN